MSGLSCSPGVMSHWSAGEVRLPEAELWDQHCKANGRGEYQEKSSAAWKLVLDHTVYLPVVALVGDF